MRYCDTGLSDLSGLAPRELSVGCFIALRDNPNLLELGTERVRYGSGMWVERSPLFAQCDLNDIVEQFSAASQSCWEYSYAEAGVDVSTGTMCTAATVGQ